MRNVLAAVGLATVVFHGGAAMADLEVKRWNPPGFSQPAGYVQVVTITGEHKQVLLGGKAGLTADGKMPPTLGEQAKLTFENIKRALEAEGGDMKDVVELQIFIVDLQKIDPNPAYQAVRDAFPPGFKPVSMVIGVSALAIPGLMMEVNVRAAVPLKTK